MREHQLQLSELKNKISELKNTLEGFNSRLDEAEQISELEERAVEVIQLGQQKENRTDEDSLRDLGDTMKQTNIHIIKVADGEEKGAENLHWLTTFLTWSRKRPPDPRSPKTFN